MLGGALKSEQLGRCGATSLFTRLPRGRRSPYVSYLYKKV